jgi:DNA-binding NtrC family response regulator
MSEPSTARVLIADDEPSIRLALREILEESGCEVADVDNGDAAFEALASSAFQLAFLDIRMPGQTGLELLERVESMGTGTAIVIITAQNTFENAVQAMRRGALDYLVKPFGIDEVRAIVGRVLRTQALERELRALERLLRHSWPGDVRELENAVKRALVLSSSEPLGDDDFAFLEANTAAETEKSLEDLVRGEVAHSLDAADGGAYRRIIERVERPLIETALARTEGNQIRAAALLGINRNTLRKKIAQLGIQLPGRA